MRFSTKTPAPGQLFLHRPCRCYFCSYWFFYLLHIYPGFTGSYYTHNSYRTVPPHTVAQTPAATLYCVLLPGLLGSFITAQHLPVIVVVRYHCWFWRLLVQRAPLRAARLPMLPANHYHPTRILRSARGFAMPAFPTMRRMRCAIFMDAPPHTNALCCTFFSYLIVPYARIPLCNTPAHNTAYRGSHYAFGWILCVLNGQPLSSSLPFTPTITHLPLPVAFTPARTPPRCRFLYARHGYTHIDMLGYAAHTVTCVCCPVHRIYGYYPAVLTCRIMVGRFCFARHAWITLYGSRCTLYFTPVPVGFYKHTRFRHRSSGLPLPSPLPDSRYCVHIPRCMVIPAYPDSVYSHCFRPSHTARLPGSYPFCYWFARITSLLPATHAIPCCTNRTLVIPGLPLPQFIYNTPQQTRPLVLGP